MDIIILTFSPEVFKVFFCFLVRVAFKQFDFSHNFALWLSNRALSFTKLFCPFVKHWQSNLVLYLNNGVACLSNFEQAKQVTFIVEHDFSNAVVVFNEEQSVRTQFPHK